MTQVSNALGTVTPVEQIVEMAHRAGALRADRRRAVGAAPAGERADARARTSSCSPGTRSSARPGSVCVYGRPEVLEAMPPWEGGGNMIADVTFEKTVYQKPPNRFEAGTGNIADAVGLGAALDYVEPGRAGDHRRLRALAAGVRDAADAGGPRAAPDRHRDRTRPACCRSCWTGIAPRRSARR